MCLSVILSTLTLLNFISEFRSGTMLQFFGLQIVLHPESQLRLNVYPYQTSRV